MPGHKKILAATSNGGLYVFDLKGTLLWRKDLLEASYEPDSVPVIPKDEIFKTLDLSKLP